MTKARRRGIPRQQVVAIQKDRSQIDDQVGSKANILGSMIGVKLINGEPTAKLGMTFFVHEKIDVREIPPRSRIPKKISVGQHTWPTDVLVWPKMVEQVALPASSITFDENLQGTLTCFARKSGTFFGLSCAHCLKGKDGNPATPTNVQLWSPTLRKFIEVGDSVLAVFSAGTRIAGTSGFIDCGIFEIENSQLLNRARKAKPLTVVADVKTMLHQEVFGHSTFTALGDTMRTATVIGIDQKVLDHKADLILMAQPPGFFQGDSGMLWVTNDGRAVGIHTRGELKPNGEGSQLIAAMSTIRATKTLDITLLIG